MSVINACHAWRALKDSVDYPTAAIINIVDVSFGRTLGQLYQFEPIGEIIPPGSAMVAVVGTGQTVTLLIQSLIYTVFPAAEETVFFLDSVEQAEAFLAHQLSK